MVEGSVITRSVPQIALAFTVGIRFANNIYGGMQFVDWARLFGVQWKLVLIRRHNRILSVSVIHTKP